MLLVLREVTRRARPAADLRAERRGVFAEPEQALDLLELELAVLLFELLQLRRVMSADEVGQPRLVRRLNLEKAVAADHGEGRRQVGFRQVVPGVSAAWAGEGSR